MSDTNHQEQAAKKAANPFSKYWFIWVGMAGILCCIAFVALLAYAFMVQTAKAEQIQAQLETEFKAIALLPNASLVDYSAWQKTTNAAVYATYSTDANPDDIFKHYDEQLKQHGWQFQGTKKVTEWDKDLGGKAAEYCKGDYGATLFYAGEKAHFGWTYDFSMSWGSNDCKTGK